MFLTSYFHVQLLFGKLYHDLGSIPGWGRFPLEKEMATHSSILAWKIPWTEKPGRLQSTGSQRVGHSWVTKQQQQQYLLKVRGQMGGERVVWGHGARTPFSPSSGHAGSVLISLETLAAQESYRDVLLLMNLYMNLILLSSVESFSELLVQSVTSSTQRTRSLTR